jgi:hypothetical protein
VAWLRTFGRRAAEGDHTHSAIGAHHRHSHHQAPPVNDVSGVLVCACALLALLTVLYRRA